MSQTTLKAFFQSRKRPANVDIHAGKSKIPHIDRSCKTSSESLYKVYNTKKYEVTNNKSKQKNNSECDTEKVELQNSLPNGSEIELQSQEITETQTPTTAFSKKLNVTNISKNVEHKSTVLIAARKDLSLGDIRKRLASSSKLAELKESAEKLSIGIQKLKEANAKKNLKEFKSIDLEVTISPTEKTLAQNELLSPKKDAVSVGQRPLISPRKVIVSPVKSPSKVPAYIRHAALATSSTTLPLPHHYRFLAELFRGMETVVALLYNRNEKITFTKLKPSVQEMLKRSFTEKHLAQIKHLVPDFYNFEVNKVKKITTSSQRESFELIISPNFPNEIKLMNPSILLERRRYFYDTLLQLVKKHHAQYLLTIDPPMVIPDNKLTRWHPEFELEKVPEVEVAKLPEIPNVAKISTAQDVLAKARELFKCNTKMERALEKLAQAKARGLTNEEKAVMGINTNQATEVINTSVQTTQPSTSGVTILNPALRNLPASLLEKVKAKQAAKALETMTRSSQHDQKYLIYSRLPDLARTLRNIFVTERKNVLALNIILSKLDSSFKANISASDLEKDIKVLTEELPEWIKIHNIRNNTYLKLDKNTDLKNITSKLDMLADKFKND